MSKKVMTVLGEISSDNLGITLPHEHLLWDQACWAHEEPRELWLREQCRKPVMLENRGHVVYHNFYYRDNLYQTDLHVAINEANKFKMAYEKTHLMLLIILYIQALGIGHHKGSRIAGSKAQRNRR